MCITIVTYTDWACGWRQNTGTHRAACYNRSCRLSDLHRQDEHDCQRECTDRQLEDQHLIMERRRDVCQQCQVEGRGRGEHPGSHGANGSQNGTNGTINYVHVGIPGAEEFRDMQ
ncbi:hypothetical protein BV20DRAFT_980327 [Pilatotrama ljubarskyi]|nr:hypothetical protein BV20DRAFT_980327 [Pilatotrama ljubarskyi]